MASITTQVVHDIDDLYEEIYNNQNYLDDSKPLVSTPLHIVASAGNVQVATEIMRLKPSLAWKLNQQGQSPIHLAMQQQKNEMVVRFVEINKNLVRVKAKGGLTPLHLASQNGHVDLLANFLQACPDSIEDVTVRSETSLHIAVNHDKFEAFEVLLGWLKGNDRNRARQLEKTILNWKDEAGNTILHILANKNNQEMIQLLINTGMDLNAMNLGNKTALDLAVSGGEISRMLIRARAKHGGQVINGPTLATKLRLQASVKDKTMINISRIRNNITEDQRNALLVVVTLIATATYQSVLSPPGGLYQANAGDNNANATVFVNSTATAAAAQGNAVAGTTIMSSDKFIVFFGLNTMSLLLSTITLFILTPSVDVVSSVLSNPGCWLVFFLYLFFGGDIPY